jgi:pimeloyl-ACP methyl ester carboxylesterase
VILHFDVSERVGAIATPTTVLCGRADRLTPPSESVRLAERIPGARLEIVPGAGHMLMFEAPDRLEEVVLGSPTTGAPPPAGADGPATAPAGVGP